MRKRLFLSLLLALGLIAVTIPLVDWGMRARSLRSLSGKLTISDPALAASDLHSYSAGKFTITLSTIGQEAVGGYKGARLQVVHSAKPGKWLWHTQRGQAFVAAARGAETVSEARGSYFFSDRLSQTCADQTIDSVETSQNTVTIQGQLQCADRKAAYQLTFQPAPISENQLTFSLKISDPAVQNPLNRLYLTYASDTDEHFFGFGEQFTYFDLKGQRVPIWVSEQGIGRGQQPLTSLVDLAAKSGGNAFTTYAAVPQYITSRLRSVFLENTGYTVFDLRSPNQVQISTFDASLTGHIVYGGDPEALISEYTLWAGRMRLLPDWILSGAVVGMQGGTDKVRQVYAQLKQRGTPVSAFWLQDWVGQRTTSFGKQLWWNWELDPERYPNWDDLRADLAKDNVRLMVYTSPFLADIGGLKPNISRTLFKEARDAGYLVRHIDGAPYLIQNTDFSAGLIDLTNPAAVEWYQSVLKQNIIDAAGASGWMADFGEALPYDALLFNGDTGADFHNRYPEAWAQFNRQLVDALPDGEQYVFFTRSAFSRSPAATTLMWEGDQTTTWDANDGIKSAVTGLLSGGISGFSLNHSDIGGYTGINNPLLHVSRSKELLLRWMELSAFTTIYRTHEGNTPDQNAQFYDDEETYTQFDRFARVYAAWGFLRQRLVKDAAETGVPVVHALFLHYPDDPVTWTLSYQEFMVGPDILVAPVLDPGKSSLRLYLPAGNWLHVWSGTPFRSPFVGQWVTIDAPLGQPAVFVKEGAPDGEQFLKNLRDAGLLK